ncbi:M20/M25/M40 family metallo-hydrolase [Phenylobacterium sp.]|uniref:M20/M25/M40 family metallo-hydrolase n=1 Tax=Phenylobacterium sp. TaxID=1871053 RepID=UPI0025ECA9D3|nr:M20/M25/M40 family metallo-hydrolase [Phenylobacterium sp.]MBX3485717.1 M20/M25/M40 family metallo-hydrolase [Phenylobacterium sp.]MCW5758819.1 M20/M25/M40 family metallo-hydrolase [Phenylobacterium sp.]
MGRLLALLLALIAGSYLAYLDQVLPESAPLSTSPLEFSGERAFQDVRFLAAVPHPVGSVANANVRDAIVGKMLKYGLSPEVRPGVGVFSRADRPGFFGGAYVENIVGVLPGRDRNAPALALLAHYDSVPGSPGAADDLMGVAAALETVRAIAAHGVPARDVIVVITDGEEAGLLGANHFFHRDPMARRVGFVVNLEARGSAGRAQMFQTHPRNGELIGLFQANARRPASSSLAVMLYEVMPNDTDLTESLRAGVDGMNFAIIGRQFDYHSPTSTAQNLERGSLQDMGDQVLAVSRELAFADALPGHAPSPVYANLFGDVLVAYPAWVGWVLILVIGGLIAVSVRWARQSGEFPAADLLRGAGAFAFAGVGAAAILQFARRLTGAEFGYLEQRFLLAQAQRWEWAIMLVSLGFMMLAAAELSRSRRWVAFLPLAAGLACSALAMEVDWIGGVTGALAALIGWFTFGRPVSRKGAWAGGLVFCLLLTIALQALAPAAAFVLAWPLLAAAVAAAATSFGAKRNALDLLLLAVLAAAALGWEGGVSHTAFESMDFVPLFAIQMITAAMVLWPLAQPDWGRSPARIIGAALLLGGLGLTLIVRSADPWSPRRPQITYVGFQQDQDTGRAWRFALPGAGRAWTDQVLKADSQAEPQRLKQWWWWRPHDMAPATPIASTAPTFAMVREPDKRLKLSVTLPPEARTLELRLRSTVPARVMTLGGGPVGQEMAAGKWVRVSWTTSGPPLELSVKPTGPGRLDIAYVAGIDGWPGTATPLPARPADLMPWDDSDSTFLTGTRAFTW